MSSRKKSEKKSLSPFRELTRAADFIVLALNEAVPLLNEKLARNPGPEALTNYTAFFTGFNTLVALSCLLSLNRKLLKRKSKSEKRQQKLEKERTSFLTTLRALLVALEFFTGPREEALKKIREAVLRASGNIETKFSLPLQAEPVKEKTSGSQELVRVLEETERFSLRGGFEETKFSIRIREGGAEAKILGGFHVRNFLRQQFISLNLIKQDLLTLNQRSEAEIKEYYLRFSACLLDYKVSLSALSDQELFTEILFRSGALDLLYAQIFSPYLGFLSVAPGFLELDQLIGGVRTLEIRIDQKGEETQRFLFTWSQDLEKTLLSLVEFFEALLGVRDRLREQSIRKQLIARFKQINELTEADQVRKLIDSILEPAPSYSPGSRDLRLRFERISQEIREKRFIPRIQLKARAPETSRSSPSLIGTLQQLLNQALRQVERESGFAAEAQRFEERLDELAALINELKRTSSELEEEALSLILLERILKKKKIAQLQASEKKTLEARLRTRIEELNRQTGQDLRLIYGAEGINFDLISRIF